MSALGDYLQNRREAMGLNQTEFTEIAGVDRAYYSQVESGRIKMPGADVRRKLARALGVQHVDLLVAAGFITAEEVSGEDDLDAEPRTQNDQWAREVYIWARAVEWDDARLHTIMSLMQAWVEADKTGWRARRLRDGGPANVNFGRLMMRDSISDGDAAEPVEPEGDTGEDDGTRLSG